jgi:hypothetical protein
LVRVYTSRGRVSDEVVVKYMDSDHVEKFNFSPSETRASGGEFGQEVQDTGF